MVNKKIWTLGPLLMVAGLILAGCNFPNSQQIPTVTPTLPPELSQLVETPPAPADPAACLVGSWQMQDITPLLAKILPADILESNQLTLTGTEGIFRYTFTSDGTITGTAENYKVLAQTKRGPFTIDVVATLNGQGIGNYTVDPQGQKVHFTNLKDQGFNLDVSAAGISVLKQDSSDLGIWFGGKNESSAGFVCSDQSLNLTLNYDGQEIPVAFNRISR